MGTVHCAVSLNDIDSNIEIEARNIYGISAATATYIGHGMPLWAGLRQYLRRLIYDWFLVSGLDVTGVTEHEKIYDSSH